MKIWVNYINGNADQNNSNDTLFTSLSIMATAPSKKVMVEQFLSTFDGYSPDGQDKLAALTSGSVIAVNIHDGDSLKKASVNGVIGRAGRDGLPAEAWMIYGLSDVVTMSQMIAQSESADERKRVERQKLESLLAYAEAPGCRRELLLGAFGETYPGPCGHCDNCIAPPPTWDATVPAQKALSAVYRTGQRFGSGHVIDVLRGEETERVLALDHHRLSTFGIGAEMDEKQWRSVFRQLLAAGLLEADAEGYGTLRLTAASRSVLSGGHQVKLREDARPERASRRRRDSKLATNDKSRGSSLGIESWEQGLWDALRALRTQLAKQQGVPPYVVFHDAHLAEMALTAPVSLDELGAVSGVGAKKLAAYGEELLRVLATG